MQKDYSFEHEQIRKELWCKIFVIITGNQHLIGENVGRVMADAALKDFDSRFPVPVESRVEVKLDGKTFYEKTGFKTPPNFTEDKIG